MKQSVITLLWLHATACALASDVDYGRDIRPLLMEKCSSCHGVLKQEAGLRLDAGRLVRQGGDSGAIIDQQDPAASLIVQRVASSESEMRMPPADAGEPLTSAQVQLLRTWISSGAPSPDDELVTESPSEHWAYQTPQRPPVPSVADAPEWNHPIDAFVSAQHRAIGLRPARMADRSTLLRRVYLDVLGVPPTVAQRRRFLADDSAHAWQRVVDQLLSNPAHAERWARHWMDVWRYSDWDGYKDEVRGSQRHIWRWRDWIMQSLANDKGYDQMIIEMLAGDEAAPEDHDVLRATGFLARNFHNSNRDIWLDATVEHTAKAFLAMTINCARCHDHKYDPISHSEYYQWRAVFEPHHVRIERMPGEADRVKQGLARVFDAKPDDPTYVYLAGNEKQADKDHPVSPSVPGLFQMPFEVAPVQLPIGAAYPDLRSFIEREDMQIARTAVATAGEQLASAKSDDDRERLVLELRIAESKLGSLQARWAADKAKHLSRPAGADFAQLKAAAVAAERAERIAQAELSVWQARRQLETAERKATDNSTEPNDAVQKARQSLESAQQQLAKHSQPDDEESQKYTPVGTHYPAVSTGRRLALARWITNPQHPLTARVAVNHVWLRHFGEPLVVNVFDFGMRSPPPQYQDLLDWLAVEFIESGWSMRHLHQLIVTSRTYRLASSAEATTLTHNRKIDPDNRYLWRANVRRLDAEAIRDSLLHVAGNLDQQRGGPDIDFQQGESNTRRSVYFRHAYEKQMRMLVLFDAAGPNECYRRSQSIIPQQALALYNSSLAIDQTRQLANRLLDISVNDDGLIQAAFESILGRACTAEELDTCRGFLSTQAKQLAHPQTLQATEGNTSAPTPPAQAAHDRACQNLVHVLINHNDFVTVR